MRFLVDAQLPPALARWLDEEGHIAEHVIDCGLESDDDKIIWDYAKDNGAAIITKDEDFAIRVNMSEDGPSIIWLRIGNSSRKELLNWFSPVLPKIIEELEQGERLVEIT